MRSRWSETTQDARAGAIPRPVLIYDGGCGLCVRWVASWRRGAGEAIEYLPSEHATERFPGIPVETMASAVLLVGPDRRLLGGASAVFAALEAAGRRWPRRAQRWVPGFSLLAEAAYRFVARRREAFGRLDRRVFGDGDRTVLGLDRWHLLQGLVVAGSVLCAAGTIAAAAAVWRVRCRRPQRR